MNYVTQGREPADALRFFEEISAIPRPSRCEAAIAQYVKKFAEDRGLEVHVDEYNNVLVRKPGSKGCENLPPVLLQGHLDIVPEKDHDVDHDFEKDSLKLRLDGDILRATGTTLGADDGVAIAYMLAILDRNDLVHPPLECMMTSMEEIGLLGAGQIKPGTVTAKRMIGLDAGPEGKFLVSSAGGNYVFVTVPMTWEPAEGKALAIEVRGLLGGHSGVMIDQERGNANKILGRVLYRISKEYSFRLAEISGGAKSNAIPREADAVILVRPEDAEGVKAIVARVEQEVQTELAFSDKGVKILTADAEARRMMSADCTEKVVTLSNILPSGCMAKSKAIEGLTTASLNVGVVTTDDEKVFYDITVRSAEDSLVVAISDTVLNIAKAVGVQAETAKDYPAFSYVDESPMRDLVMEFYKKQTGKDGEIRAVHGGTECGLFRKLVPGIDIVGMGPDKGNAHTPEEWMDIVSFGRVYQFLIEVLEELTRR